MALYLSLPLPSSLLKLPNGDDKSDHGDYVEDGYQSTSMLFESLFFSYSQISVGALYYQVQNELHDRSDSDDDTAIVVSLPQMPQPEKLDIKSCEQFLLELFEQWMSLYIQPKTPLALMSEATKAVSWGLLSVDQELVNNWPFPSYLWPLFQSESWCSSFHMKISFICM